MKLATLLSVSMLATGSAFAAATATSENVFGVLRVDSSNAQTIVSVPWVNASAGAESGVKVVDLVKTSTLSEGDELYWYDSSAKSYKAWKLNESKVWEGAAEVREKDENDEKKIGIVAGGDQNLPRGDALILKRTKPTDPGYFFLCGQYTTSSATTTIAVGSIEEPAFTLLAPPTASSGQVDLNAATWTGVGDKDNILISGADGSLQILTYKDKKWGMTVWDGTPPTKTRDVTKALIDAGIGIWYKSVNGSDTSVQW